VEGNDIKNMLAMIHFNLSSWHFVLNAVLTNETGWGMQLNSNAIFGFCSSNVDDCSGLQFYGFGKFSRVLVFYSASSRRRKDKQLYLL
jgi:hypothetical protein